MAAIAQAAAPDCARHPLLSPTACCSRTAPAAFNVTFTTSTVGAFTIALQRRWSPFGVDRFYNLATCHYFDSTQEPGNDAGIFRVVPGFVAQFGISGSPAVSAQWEDAIIQNDPVVLSNVRGTIAFAAVQDSSGQAVNRTTQVSTGEGEGGGGGGTWQRVCKVTRTRPPRSLLHRPQSRSLTHQP
jgi:peptidyl-prolyl cis-trans isomerase A (cyclophilin A)